MAREKSTFFWQGPFSQWHHSRFTVSDRQFFCAEQFMMYCKAVLFRDTECAAKILQSPTPQQQKALGRQVRDSHASGAARVSTTLLTLLLFTQDLLDERPNGAGIGGNIVPSA